MTPMQVLLLMLDCCSYSNYYIPNYRDALLITLSVSVIFSSSFSAVKYNLFNFSTKIFSSSEGMTINCVVAHKSEDLISVKKSIKT